MRMFWIIISVLFVASGYSQAAGLYKWVDKTGKVHYGDQPAEDAIKPEQKNFSASVSTNDDDLPYSLRKAKSEFPVTLYVASNCGDLCVQARAMLNKRGIPFSEKSLSTTEDISAFKSKYGGNSTPALTIGKTFLSEYEAGQWNSELDSAGYPKTAPYGLRQAKPAEVKPSIPPEAGK